MAEPFTVVAQQAGIFKTLDPEDAAFWQKIDEFVQDRPLLDLFLLALEQMQKSSILKPGVNATDRECEHTAGLGVA